MRGKRITTDELARMIQEEVVAHMATKGDISELYNEIGAFRDEVNIRFDKLEPRVNLNHDRRLELLEDSMRQVKTKLGIK